MSGVLVFGKTGQVARDLAALVPEARFLGRDEADLTDPAACGGIVRASGADLVINAAAYTAVDQAEADEAMAALVNGAAPGAIAEAAVEIGAALVQISTDYVFDGSGSTPWLVDAPTAPLGAYGRTKLAGEEAVRAAGGVHAILRTSWVFSAHGTNFVKSMLRLSQTRDRLNVVADQIGGPTPARPIARAVLAIGQALRDDPTKFGTYHFTGAPDVSWADFAREIFRQAGRSVGVQDIPTSTYPTPAQRPLNSRLDCSRTREVFGIDRPEWRAGLAEVLKDLKELS
ncbi:dTDP-4-dehydrorhamnose reductase [Sinisalibacter lacisalsi]|uniref:dTDP-4-dehydrorhamnose reductase n=1 Tax=Sinisalibacter lacisalsi TaxID=1526570 RepID=A0ABQ1QJJ0_9RHOB|nr:dTDP-4-dehydrorhamnose reductase [Sinisalibacter lacisalsi]GGD29971.1 NAD(P)-dependent oxidoreductase [Sinisalibacter lacisalsi]